MGALHHRDIAVFQIGDAVGEGRQRESVGAQIGFFFGIAHRQRRALARADQKTFMILEDHGDGIGAGQPRAPPPWRPPPAPCPDPDCR